MEKKLKTLREHEEDEYKKYVQSIKDGGIARLNGIACPKCGEELYDSNPHSVLLSYPPKTSIICLNHNCNYEGYRIL